MDHLNSTNCNVYWQVYPDPSSSPYSTIPFSIFYITLFLLGLFGNCTVIFVSCNNKALLSVQNIFILNMAASDIMMCILSLPITPITNIYKNWYFGNLLCHLIPCIQGISIFVCTFSLAAIALDRYILVVNPHMTPLTQKGAVICTFLLWILSFIVTLPYAFNMQMVDYMEEHICGYFCTEKWQSAKSRRTYTLVVMFTQFVIPFSVMAFCYLNIFDILNKRTKLNIFLDKQEKEKQRVVYQTRRTTTILVTMVMWFGITWLPHNVISSIIEFDESQMFFRLYGRDDLDISYLLNLFTHCFAMTNNVVNPVLYAWLNPTFHRLVLKTYFGRDKIDRRNSSNNKSSILIAHRKLLPRSTNPINIHSSRPAVNQWIDKDYEDSIKFHFTEEIVFEDNDTMV